MKNIIFTEFHVYDTAAIVSDTTARSVF